MFRVAQRVVRGGLLGFAGLAAGCAAPSVPAPEVAASPEEVAVGAADPRAGWLGQYLDAQATELDDLPGAEVERRVDAIVLRFAGAELFASRTSAALRVEAPGRLRALAEILNAYPQSHVIVKGHADGGPEAATEPQALSDERAWAVRDFLRREGVHPSRISAIGFAATLPLASNATEAGRARNRRLEIEIRPHDEILWPGSAP